MGSSNKHWRRAKFMRRFRLFFRYHTNSKSIIYVWLNDENTLRKAGASSDVYSVFAGMLSRGKPPTDWDDLVRACEGWSATSAGAAVAP
jgi:toxin YhaV